MVPEAMLCTRYERKPALTRGRQTFSIRLRNHNHHYIRILVVKKPNQTAVSWLIR